MCQITGTTILVTLITVLITNLGLLASAAPLILFEDSGFRGVRTEFTINGPETCVNIRGKLNDFFSSVQNSEAGDCFMLCEHEFCRGRCMRITQSVTSLNSIGFNDVTSSIKRCPIEETTILMTTSPIASSSPTTTTTTIRPQVHGESISESQSQGQPESTTSRLNQGQNQGQSERLSSSSRVPSTTPSSAPL